MMDAKPCAYPHLLHSCWQRELEDELAKPYMFQLRDFVARERQSGVPIYPPNGKVFNALDQVPFDNVRVVIIGQDPYHGPGQAEGLSFSVPRGIKIPPSLRNIYQELHSDLGIPPAKHGHLISWCKQGVLLLNATLTVRQGQAASHQKQGWEQFTDAVIDRLCKREKPLVFLLWGRPAQQKVQNVLVHQQDGAQRHLVLTSPHPSPLSAHRGFLGCRHFSKVNQWLADQGEAPIDWRVPE